MNSIERRRRHSKRRVKPVDQPIQTDRSKQLLLSGLGLCVVGFGMVGLGGKMLISYGAHQPLIPGQNENVIVRPEIIYYGGSDVHLTPGGKFENSQPGLQVYSPDGMHIGTLQTDKR